MKWLAQCLKNKLNCGFNTHNSWHRVYLCVSFFISFLIQIPVTFRYADAVACSYCDIEIKFCLFFRHPHNWWYSSASQHEIPVSSTNFIENLKHFKLSFHVWHPSLHLQLFFTLYQKTNATKHIFAITPLMTVGMIKIFTLERTTSLEMYLIKRTVRTLPAAGNFSERQTERQTDTD